MSSFEFLPQRLKGTMISFYYFKKNEI